MSFLPRILIAFLFLTLASCANLSTKNEVQSASFPPNAEVHLASIANLHNFNIEARIGIQTHGHGISGKLYWHHLNAEDEITFYSPLGAKLASIMSSDTGAMLITNDGKVYESKDAESLIKDKLGWNLPLISLANWVLGKPSIDKINASKWDADGKLMQLTQLGWNIQFINYQEVEMYQLPNKINLYSSDINAKLVIDRWETPFNLQSSDNNSKEL